MIPILFSGLHRRKDKGPDFAISKDHLFAQSAAWYFPRCFRQQTTNQQQQLDPDHEGKRHILIQRRK
jgi:hypothetical protein